MVRQSELAVARRAARLRPRPARQGVQTAQLVGIDEDNAGRVIVSFDGSEVSVLAGAGKLVPGSLVAVEVDALGAPVRVHGAVTVRPEGLDDDLPAPEPVEPMPELAPREISEAEAQAIVETAANLAAAQAELEAFTGEAAANFSALDGKLAQAFPGGVFDVPGAIAAAETDVLAQAALDAQAAASAAAAAAQAAAEQFAAGEISAVELRAAEAAEAAAEAARLAAVEAAALDADSKAGQALAAAEAYARDQAADAIAAAAADAQAKADAAAQAAQEAAEQHADLVAQGASADAIAAAAADAQAKADAAEAAARAHADAQAAAAQAAAETHATNEAARVKQEALTEAATDAQAKAEAAASAALSAAEAHADLVAQGAEQAAIDAAAADAQAKADAARDAAITAAQTYADARKAEAIDAAALTAQAKADVAKADAIAQAQADLAALELGGRNLLLNSAQPVPPFHIYSNNGATAPIEQGTDETGFWLSGVNTASGYFYLSTYTVPTFDSGRGSVFSEAFFPQPEVYTQSVEVMADVAMSVRLGGTAPATTLQPNVWTRVTRTFTASDSSANRLRLWGPHVNSTPDVPLGTKVYLRNWKLERGSKATDWTPAPEDVDAAVATAQGAAQAAQGTADAAATAASTAQAAADAAAGVASTAQAEAATAQAAADDALSKYGPLDQRTLDAQAAADAAATAASTAQAAADAAATAASAAQGTADAAATAASAAQGTADDAYQLADDAMRTADGKNVATYSTVTSAPGAAPTTASGQGRAQFDVHRNRLADGTIVGEWLWSGSSWVQVHLGDAMLRSLDVGKLTAGTGSFTDAVITRLWTDLAVINRLQAITGWVGGTLLADGAVTTRTLNVVPDEGTGGVEILPPGLRIIPGDETAGTAVSLRTDEPNLISFAKNGVSTFSVSPEGDLATETVNARQALTYKGQELTAILDQFPRGIIARSEATGDAWVGGDDARIAMCTFTAPAEDRMIRITFECGISSFAQAYFMLKQAVGTVVNNSNSIKHAWYRTGPSAGSANNMHFEMVMRAGQGGWGWPAGQTISVGGFVRNLASGTFRSHPNYGRSLTIEDVGPEVDVVPHPIYVPGSTGSDSGTSKQKFTKTWVSTGHRTYSYTGLTSTRAGISLVQGYAAGANSRGHWLFNDADIRANLNGAVPTSGTLKITNEHTWNSTGMSAVLRTHGYSSAPSTFGTSTPWTTVHVPRGGTVSIPITAAIAQGLASGSVRGFSLDAGGTTSTTYYGYFSPRAELTLNYSK